MTPKEHHTIVLSLEEWKDETNQEINYIIVEGKNDKKSLYSLSIPSIIIYPSQINLVPSHSTALILTDFDKEGKDMHKRIKNRLEGIAIINDTLRSKLRSILTAYGRHDIESINNLVKKY